MATRPVWMANWRPCATKPFGPRLGGGYLCKQPCRERQRVESIRTQFAGQSVEVFRDVRLDDRQAARQFTKPRQRKLIHSRRGSWRDQRLSR